MYKKIFVSIDKTRAATKILHEAIDIAKSSGATLRVVHIVNVQIPGFGVPMFGMTDINEAVFRDRNKFIGRLKAILTKEKVEGQVELLKDFGTGLADIISKDAKEFGADLIVLSASHLGSLKHLITGGVAEKLAHITDIPIMLITKHKL